MKTRDPVLQLYSLMRLKTLSVTAPGGAPLMHYQYGYNPAGNILTKQTEHGNYNYDYDLSSRLTVANNPMLTDETYSYDAVGNRLTASNAAGTIAHNQNNELTTYGEKSFDYDANGNMTRKAVGTAAVNYIYNAANRLIRVEDELSGTVIAKYDYDPFGRRVWKEVNGIRTYFFYSDEGLIAEYDGQGNELRSYGYQADSTWTTDPLFLKQSGTYYWYQNDHLGTPQKLTAQDGTVVWSAQYAAFGEATVSVETVTNNLRFPGQYYDAETGLHYNWFRYYSSELGRYIRVDPIGFESGEVNLYGYAENNPKMHIDANGLQSIGDFYLPDDATDVQKAFYPSFYSDNLFWEHPVAPCTIEIHAGHYRETPHRFIVSSCAGATVNSCNSNGGIEEYTGLGLFVLPKEFEPTAFPGSQYTVNPVYNAIDDGVLFDRIMKDINAAELYAKQLCQECCECEEITLHTKCYSITKEAPQPLRYPSPLFPAPVIHKTRGALYDKSVKQILLYRACEENKYKTYSCQR